MRRWRGKKRKRGDGRKILRATDERDRRSRDLLLREIGEDEAAAIRAAREKAAKRRRAVWETWRSA